MPPNSYAVPIPVEIDDALLERYDVASPYYACYPTADRFVEAFDVARHQLAVQAAELVALPRAVSLSVHLPQCHSPSCYCADNTTGTDEQVRADAYLDYVEREIALHQALLGEPITVTRVHVGGGTLTALSDAQVMRLLQILRQAFRIVPDADFSVEIDPSNVGSNMLRILAEQGFCRLSMCAHDLAPAEELLRQAHDLGYRSTKLDLIYGLPQQTPAAFAETLKQISAWQATRIALFPCAHLPERYKGRRNIALERLPALDVQRQMQHIAHEKLSSTGYVYIGMGHFALAHDDLVQAMLQGRLHRHLQGYSSHADGDVIGLGVSAIGKMGASYSQNHRKLQDYYDAIDHGLLAISRGIALSHDDLLRRAIIQALLCQHALLIEPFETNWMIHFQSYFAEELQDLRTLADAGLISIETRVIRILPRGRLLTHVVAMVFDRYLRDAKRVAMNARIL